MSIKRILTPLSGRSDSATVAAAACDIAKVTAGHVVGCYVTQGIPPYVYFGGIGGSVGLYSGQIAESLHVLNERQLKDAAAIFASVRERHGVSSRINGPTPHGPSAEWAGDQGGPLAFANAARLADVVVVAQPADDKGFDHIAVFEAALLRAKRPVLVAPDAAKGIDLATVAIAFNGSAEGARAVTEALPLLENAGAIHILTAGARNDDEPSAADLKEYLGWHGLKATCHAREAAAGNAAETLLSMAHEVGAKLLIMGGYTHSHLREMVMGGVTRYMLERSDVPLFMVH
ncbi:MAG: universal stress protein [Rhodospirillaceae bacterium]|nr:universal stress protein [Rhodospirillaceae bacterium]